MALLGTYPPRECGIATFTHDLGHALAARSGWPPAVVAVDEPGADRAYPPEVRWRLAQEDPGSYRRLAAQLNAAADLLCVQHEYGLYGGERGALLLELLDRLDIPVVTTLHTVLGRPDPALAAITRELYDRSSIVVVLARQAIRLLTDAYGVDGRKLRFVPHGVPTVGHQRDAAARTAVRARLGVAGRTVLTTFGLLGPNKGVEHALQALPAVAAAHPGVLYTVLGATHPGERRGAGEAYRQRLRRTAAALGVARHVRFVDRYLTGPELLAWLDATDVCVLPYREPEQISSGTLAYALAAGKPVIATKFRSAREVLGTGGGGAGGDGRPGRPRRGAAAAARRPNGTSGAGAAGAHPEPPDALAAGCRRLPAAVRRGDGAAAPECTCRA